MMFNELKFMIKRKTTMLLFVILTLGTSMTAILAIEQGGRLYQDGTILQGKDAIVLQDQESKRINGILNETSINEVMKFLYHKQQTSNFSMDEKINFLNSQECLTMYPYINLLLKLYDEPNQGVTYAYEQLYEVGKHPIAFYELWKEKVLARYGETKQQEVLQSLLYGIEPFHYEAGSAGRIMISKFQDLMLLYMIIIAILFSATFAKDRMTHADQTILTTKKGVKTLAKARCSSAVLMMTLLYLYAVVLYSVIIVSQLGTSGFSTSIQLSFSALSPYQLNVLEAYLRMLVLAYIMNLMVTYVILYCSSKTKKAYYVILISFLILFVGYMMTQTSSSTGIMQYVMMFLPSGIMDPALLFSFYSISIGSVTLWFPILVGVFFLGCSILIRWRILAGSESYAVSI